MRERLFDPDKSVVLSDKIRSTDVLLVPNGPLIAVCAGPQGSLLHAVFPMFSMGPLGCSFVSGVHAFVALDILLDSR